MSLTGLPELEASIPWDDLARNGHGTANEGAKPEPPSDEKLLSVLREAGEVCERARRRRESEPSYRRGLEAWRAMMLAKDLETWHALMADEAVPLSKLDPEWLSRFGRKR